MEKITNVLSKLFEWTLLLYLLISFSIFAPYYSYKFIKDHSFIEYLFLGEIAPIIKALGWPYFLYKDYEEKKIWKEINKLNGSLYFYYKAQNALLKLDFENYKKYLTECLHYAHQIHTKVIKQRYPKLAEMIKNFYIPAIEKYYSSISCERIDKEKIRKADLKFIKFINFYKEFIRKTNATEILKEKLSFNDSL